MRKEEWKQMWNSETIAPIYSESMCKSFLYLSHVHMSTHKQENDLLIVYECPWCSYLHFTVGETETWEVKQLISAFSAQVQICFCITLDSMGGGVWSKQISGISSFPESHPAPDT